MKNFHLLYENDFYKWFVIYPAEGKTNNYIATNEYVIYTKGKSLLIDPGGSKSFPEILSSLVHFVALNELEYIFSSHQDPDSISSLPLWLEINPKIKVYVSSLWHSFLPHFGGSRNNLIEIPDKGMNIQLGDLVFEAIPAHHLHSCGNFHLYDKESKIYFSGDVGAALLPANQSYLFAENFNEHVVHMEAFHRRWFGSNQHKNEWCERVSTMEIDMLCPQHGAILVGDDVKRFVDWFYKLNVGELSYK